MLAAKSLTAIANKMTPNIFRIIPSPLVPNKRSIFPEDF